jgi:polyhydroxybutyrate depolymerase
MSAARMVGARPTGIGHRRDEHDVWSRWGGQRRTYRLHAPPEDAGGEAPIIVALHFGRADARAMEILTRIVPVATVRGFAVVLPEALEGRGYWDDGRFGDTDDIGFIAHTIDDAGERLGVAVGDVYLVGFSSGATMALLAAATLGSRIQGVAAVAGTIGRTFSRRPPGPSPMPLLYMHGTHDPFAYYYTGGSSGTRRGTSLAVEELGRWWAERNGCEESETDVWADTASDGCRVESVTYRGDTPAADVTVLSIVGGGHTWPGGERWAPDQIVGRTTQQLDATTAACDFFEAHRSSASDERRPR